MPLPAHDASPAKLPETMNVEGLIGHILSNFHEKHRAELPGLAELASKVERVHHDVPEAPHGLAAALERIAREIDAHMMKEEHVLFPAMRQGAGHALAAPIAVMREDHAHHEQDIAELHALTNDFKLPEGACGSWTRLYAGVAGFCGDLREHMRLENDVLFPRFEVLAKTRCTCAHG